MDLLVREAEAALYALRNTMRQASTRSGTKPPGRQIRLVRPTKSSLCTSRSETEALKRLAPPPSDVLGRRASAAQGGTPHRLAKRSDRGFGLAHQAV